MGTDSYIQLCEKKDGKIVVYSVLYIQCDSFYDCLGTRLASFLDGFVIVNGYTFTTKYRQANGASDLFARIIAFLKESPERIGYCYLVDPSTNCENGDVDFQYKVVVDEENILFEAKGGTKEDANQKLIEDNFSGSAGEFWKKFGGNEALYSPPMSLKKRTFEEIEVSRRTEIIPKIKELANSLQDTDAGYFGRKKKK